MEDRGGQLVQYEKASGILYGRTRLGVRRQGVTECDMTSCSSRCFTKTNPAVRGSVVNRGIE